MFVTALLLGLVGVFCILDSRILGRMNFERPLITCTIVGALLGDLQTGLTLGASIELMSLGIVNIGAAAPPDMNMAAIICAAFAILTDASAETALALAIPIAVLGQMLGVLMPDPALWGLVQVVERVHPATIQHDAFPVQGAGPCFPLVDVLHLKGVQADFLLQLHGYILPSCPAGFHLPAGGLCSCYWTSSGCTCDAPKNDAR